MQHLLQTLTAASPAPKASSAILQGLPCTNTILVTLGDGTQGLLPGSLHCRATMCNRCTASACLCQAPPLRLRRCSASLQASRPSMAGAVSGEGCLQGTHSPLNMGRKAPCCSVLAPRAAAAMKTHSHSISLVVSLAAGTDSCCCNPPSSPQPGAAPHWQPRSLSCPRVLAFTSHLVFILGHSMRFSTSHSPDENQGGSG